MTSYLLDTHIAVWWLIDGRQLSREQFRVLADIDKRGDRVRISAMTILEIAVVYGVGNRRYPPKAEEIIRFIEEHPQIVIIPFSTAEGLEVAAMGPSLVDPMDRAIVATARVHRLTLITSDERIVQSKLVRVIA